MKASKLEKLFNDFGIEVYKTKQDGVGCAELNTYTAGGVNMIVWLNPFTVEDFTEYINRIKQICKNLEDYQHGKKIYIVKTKFVFEGVFRIKAESKGQACEYVQKHCRLVIGGNIHTTLPDDICDWEFDVHPKKITK